MPERRRERTSRATDWKEPMSECMMVLARPTANSSAVASRRPGSTSCATSTAAGSAAHVAARSRPQAMPNGTRPAARVSGLKSTMLARMAPAPAAV